MTSLHPHKAIGGKISIATAILGVCVILLGLVVDIPHGHIALANNATTSVTVLNTPPAWDATFYVFEAPASATDTASFPTNSGSNITFIASSSDSSGDNYYLLICDNYASPTPNNGAAPTCNGGASHQRAISPATPSGTMATAASTTYNGDPREVFYWWGYVCDGNTGGASCNALAFGTSSVATSGPQISPFIVNHRPVFSLYSNNSPANPGATVQWYATATDQDVYGGFATDSIRLFVCRAADFTGTACGAGGTWATSAFASTSATATFAIPNPNPDGTFGAYGYVVDYHGTHSASGGQQGTTRSLIVNNITPTIAAASVSLLDTDRTGPLTLTGIATQTPNFVVEYTVTDQNSCQTASSTAEIIFGLTDVYRSGITQAACNQSSMYDANNCYPGGAATTSINWKVTCAASSTAPCLGTGDSDIVFNCTFPLWYVADATDGTGAAQTDPPFFAQNWLPSAQAADDNSATSSLVEATTGTELSSFLAFTVSTTTIAYGSWQPGQDTGTVGNTPLDRTDIAAAGNVGIDETLYGSDMCPGFPAPCSGLPASTIFVGSQRYATSSIAYASAIPLLANPGATFLVHIAKSTTTAAGTQSFKTTHWGIAVPGAITLSGDYLGQNSLVGVTSDRTFW